MATKSNPIPKLTRPVSAEVYPRRRLFRLLDESRKNPVIWICGPPGSGKTTLVSSYLESKRLRHVWYQVDEGDHDAATFIYYLGLAVRRESPRIRRPLPILTPEYLPGLSVFTRRFFEEICVRLSPPAVLVFDNLQKMAADAPFQPILPEVLANLPSGITAVLVSRETPPPGYARLRANRLVETIGWKDLRLTTEEGEGIARAAGRGVRKPTAETIRHLQKRSDGWAAGLILMLEHDVPGGKGPKGRRRVADEIVDYFGGEIFDATDRETREFLLRSAFLPRMTIPMAERLTGYAGAGRLLTYLHRHNFFTEAHHHDEPVYEYHALFREFLLARAKAALPAEEIAELQRTAAGLLAERGQAEDAVALLRECGDWGELCRVILSQAPALIAQVRFQTLGEWIRFFPQSMLEEVPWLRYWMGVSGMPFHPGESRAQFEQAFRKFREQGDVPGIFMSWSGVVESTYFGFEGFTTLHPWIPALEEAIQTFGEFPSKEIGERVTCSMMKALCLTFGGSSHRGEDLWVERAFSVARTSANISTRIESLLGLFMVLLGIDFRKTSMVIEMIREQIRHPDVPTVSALCAYWYRSLHAIHDGSHDRCMEMVSEGLRLAESTGIHILDFMLTGHGALCSMITGNIAAVKDFLQKMAASQDIRRAFAAGFYHYLAAWDAMGGGELAKSRLHSDQGVKLSEEMGYRWTTHLVYLQSAFLFFESGSDDQAADRLGIARRVIMGGADYSEFSCSLAEAYFLLRRGKEEAALTPLRAGLKVGREAGLGGVFAWYPGFLELVTAKALEAGIEPEYVRELIRKNRLLPGDAHLDLEQWPWPVRIITLGRFEIVAAGKPVPFSRKGQKKPLLLLKALIALGGRDVPEEKLTDILWPEAEGDLGHQSFATNLRRLRKLLGSEKAVLLHEGRVTINSRYCWVDAWAFERIVGRFDRGETDGASPGRGAEPARLAEKAIRLYRGAFLADDAFCSCIETTRERLRSMFLRCVTKECRQSEAAGEWEKAVDCCRRGVEVDDLTEEFYRCLMASYVRQGKKAEALAVYHRLRKVLSAILRVTPSRETEALYRSLLPG